MVNQDTDRDYFMTAEEAKDYGIIDEIIQGRVKSDRIATGARATAAGRPARHPRPRHPRRVAAHGARVMSRRPGDGMRTRPGSRQ